MRMYQEGDKTYPDRIAAARWLRQRGFSVEHQPATSPFDLTVDGRIRVEVKRAQFIRGRWRVFIQRHNKLNEQPVDVYVICLEPNGIAPPSHRIFLVVPAPLCKRIIPISIPQLVTEWACFVNATAFLEGDYHSLDATLSCLQRLRLKRMMARDDYPKKTTIPEAHRGARRKSH